MHRSVFSLFALASSLICAPSSGAATLSVRTATVPQLTAGRSPVYVVPSGNGGLTLTPDHLDFSAVSGLQQTLPLTLGNSGAGPVSFTFGTTSAVGVAPHPVAIDFKQNASTANTDNGMTCLNGNTSMFSTSWWRRFPLVEVPGMASSIQLRGIDVAASPTDAPSGGSVGTTHSELHVYTLPHTFPVDTIDTSALTEIGRSSVFELDPGQSITVPVSASVIGTDSVDLVVEWRAPTDASAVLFPGSNLSGETHPSFVSATDCGVDQPTPFEYFAGTPTPAMLMTVHAQQTSGPPPQTCQAPSWLVYERNRSGTIAPGGSAYTKVVADARALVPGDYDAQICIHSSGPASKTPQQIIVPVHAHIASD
jgi:hypothetical protein